MARPALLASLLTLAGASLAQIAPGDWILSDTANPASSVLFRVDPALGQVSTIAVAPASHQFATVLMDRSNVELVAPLNAPPAVFHLLQCSPGGVIATLAPLGTLASVVDVVLDQDGTFVGISLQSNPFTRSASLWRSDPATGSTQFVVSLGNRSASGICLDGDTGDYIVSTVGVAIGTPAELLRVDRRTLVITTISSGVGGQRVDFEPSSGDFAVVSTHTIRIHRTGSWGHVSGAFSNPQALRVDPETGNLLVGAGGSVVLLSPSGHVLRSHTPPVPDLWIQGVELYGSRKVTGRGPATGGSAYAVRFSFPRSAGRAYVAALSTGLRPGFALGDGTGRTVHLDVTSPLFPISIGGLPGVTTGFTGVLDASGQATGSILIPAGFPAGVRLFVSAVALHPGLPSGLDTANSWGVTTN